jgi:hypothetical protein
MNGDWEELSSKKLQDLVKNRTWKYLPTYFTNLTNPVFQNITNIKEENKRPISFTNIHVKISKHCNFLGSIVVTLLEDA